MPNQKRRAALARNKTPARIGRGVPMFLATFERLRPLETDSNTDQSAAHTNEVHPATDGNRNGTARNCKFEQEEAMKELNYELKQMCHRNRDGSYATQADRERILDVIANQLDQAGFRNLRASWLKPRHVEVLVKRWLGESLSTGTIKNRMAHLRWWAEKIGKRNVLARDNAEYGIPDRELVTHVSKARELTAAELARVTDPYTHLSLRLQAAFGLRRAESIKIHPALADRGNALELQASWCKGGRERTVPIRNDSQRQVLDEAKAFAGKRSLIPAEARYVDQLRRFEYQCDRAGINNVHGHRHAYAQTRYREITGWDAPAAGGPGWRDLTPAQKEIDRAARLTISQELGHEREAVTSVYLSR